MPQIIYRRNDQQYPTRLSSTEPAAMVGQLEMGRAGLAAVKLAPALEERLYIGSVTALSQCGAIGRRQAEQSRSGIELLSHTEPHSACALGDARIGPTNCGIVITRLRVSKGVSGDVP
jgi:hypothetical protein